MVANLTTAARCTIFVQAPEWKELRERQQHFVRPQDSLTRRCPFLYTSDDVSDVSRKL